MIVINLNFMADKKDPLYLETAKSMFRAVFEKL